MHWIEEVNPKSILDVGVGFGKAGFLCREYLEVIKGTYQKKYWKTNIVGIEIYKPYLTPAVDFLYDKIIIGDAFQILDTIQPFDVILALDILEHFERERGFLLINKILKKAAKRVILTTPAKFIPQGEVFGNPHETHKSLWRREDFLKIGFECVEFDSIFYGRADGKCFIRVDNKKYGILVGCYTK
jgi:SAM-dependent methyltransferase